MSDFEEKEKEVYFHQYCVDCKHRYKHEEEEPCDECLENPYNFGSHKPVKFEERTAKKNG